MKTLILLTLILVIVWVLYRPFTQKELDRYNNQNWPDINL